VADIINLRRERKRRERAATADQAAENRVRFGLPKQARLQQRQEADKTRRALDGKKLETETETGR